jgi:hypothetical protein
VGLRFGLDIWRREKSLSLLARIRIPVVQLAANHIIDCDVAHDIQFLNSHLCTHCCFSKENRFRNAESDPKFGRRGGGVILIPENKGSVKEYRFASFSGITYETAFRYKNTSLCVTYPGF